MRDDANVDALQQAILTALTTGTDLKEATHALAPEWTEHMHDKAIEIARKLAIRWCRAESVEHG